MEFLPGILVLTIIVILFLRTFRGRKLEMDSRESNGRNVREVEDSLVEELRQRAEARRLKLKQDGFVRNNPDGPYSDSLQICPSCHKQNQGTTHYCVYCGMKLGSDLVHPTVHRSYFDANLTLQLGVEAEQEEDADQTKPELGRDTMGKEQVLHQSILPYLPIDKQDSLGISNSKLTTQRLSKKKIGFISQLDSRLGLKHAILMSEILGPPVSISRRKVWGLSD